MQPPVNGEVTIICLTDEVILRDLGVRLTRGAKVEVPLSAAMKSMDLQRAKIDGTVSTQTLRASTIRAHEYASSDTTTSQAPRYQPPVQNPVDLGPLMGVVQSLADAVNSLRIDVAALKNSQATVVHVAAPPSALASTPQAPPAPDAPVFIPDRIMGDDLKPTLDVKPQSVEAHGVEDAARALKNTRKKR
jgi:hypothetical protein